MINLIKNEEFELETRIRQIVSQLTLPSMEK